MNSSFATSTMARGIAEMARSAIRSPGATWFAGLGAVLAEATWARLESEAGLGPDSYGTARVLNRDARAERDVEGTLATPTAFGRVRPILIETLRPAIAKPYVDLGLELAAPAIAASRIVASRLQDAIERLASIPALAAAVGHVLHVLHVAIPEGPDFDVSYSDPDVPFSAFVGIGADGGPPATLRLAEGLLHESMHLQLSLIEGHLPLVRPGDTRLHSPWQNTLRPVQGVVHGTYVFAVIRDFMQALRDEPSISSEERRHIAVRIATCTKEIDAALSQLSQGSDLTSAGRDLATRIATRPRH